MTFFRRIFEVEATEVMPLYWGTGHAGYQLCHEVALAACTEEGPKTSGLENLPFHLLEHNQLFLRRHPLRWVVRLSN